MDIGGGMRAARTIVNAEELIAAIRDNSDLDDLAFTGPAH